MTKKVITFLFVAMLVFTGISVVKTLSSSGSKNKIKINPDEVSLIQLDTINGKIDDDAEVAIIKTSLGEIRAELYTEYAPKTTARFKELAESGYYEGTYVYEVQKDLFFSGGSLYNDGTLKEGYNKDDEHIDQETDKNLWPFKGSFMSCGLTKTSFLSGAKTIFGGSRFMVAGSIEFTDEIRKELIGDKTNTKIEDAFIEYGGLPNCSQQMTIFAQTYEGLEVIDKIMSMKSDEKTKKPLEDITIDKVEVCTYKESFEK